MDPFAKKFCARCTQAFQHSTERHGQEAPSSLRLVADIRGSLRCRGCQEKCGGSGAGVSSTAHPNFVLPGSDRRGSALRNSASGPDRGHFRRIVSSRGAGEENRRVAMHEMNRGRRNNAATERERGRRHGRQPWHRQSHCSGLGPSRCERGVVGAHRSGSGAGLGTVP